MSERTHIKSTVGFLEEVFESRKSKNSRYSKRAFARDLKMSAGRLSEILSGKRNLTLKMAQSVCISLKLNKSLTESLFKLVEKQNNLKSKKIVKRQLLSSNDFSEISNWRYYTLLCLIENSDLEDDVSYFAKKLGVNKTECEAMLNKLESLGLIMKKIDSYEIIARSTTTSQDSIDFVVRKFHENLIGHHLKLLNSIELDKREIQSLILNIENKDLRKAKKMIRSFVDHFQEKSTSKHKSDVYGLTIILNPLTEL